MQKILLLFLSTQLIVNTLLAPKIEVSYCKHVNPVSWDVQVKLNDEIADPNKNPLLPTFVKIFCSEEFIKKRYWNTKRCPSLCVIAINSGKDQLLTGLTFFDWHLDNFAVKYETPKKYTDAMLITMFALKHKNICHDVLSKCIAPFLMPTYELILEKDSTLDLFSLEITPPKNEEEYKTPLKLMMKEAEVRNKGELDFILMAQRVIFKHAREQQDYCNCELDRIKELNNLLTKYSILNSLTKNEIKDLANGIFEQIKKNNCYTLYVSRGHDYKITEIKNLDNLNLKSLKLIIINFCDLNKNNDEIEIKNAINELEIDYYQKKYDFLMPVPLEYE